MIFTRSAQDRLLPSYSNQIEHQQRIFMEAMARISQKVSNRAGHVIKEPSVLFIYESVRDFLVKDRGLYELWSEVGLDWEIPSYEKLKH
jgi:hypothetical protein